MLQGRLIVQTDTHVALSENFFHDFIVVPWLWRPTLIVLSVVDLFRHVKVMPSTFSKMLKIFLF